ncbi:GAF and ANTAR domain-containing protein [Rhodococcus pyridinivorans]|uniref:ANTAR domain-containing protein n=1 Tax=Rhodococcus pyridinivorans TaxID=103816 RepID=UPI00280B40A4|nr:GAF and ANTAR domain-containing protein [Rhodococcus pyridinivorans]WMM72035.1 GAF and ANTAR domain-containing protein [Rhodococcus pyridinivorans]
MSEPAAPHRVRRPDTDSGYRGQYPSVERCNPVAVSMPRCSMDTGEGRGARSANSVRFERQLRESIEELAREMHDDRWPAFASRAARLGARSMLAVPLYTTDDTIGALDLHSSQAGAFDDGSVDIASTLATHAAFDAVAAVREEQFRAALASRDVIGQAKGVLMERFGIDAESAFGMLRRLSQERNQLVRDLAVEVVETARPPRER